MPGRDTLPITSVGQQAVADPLAVSVAPSVGRGVDICPGDMLRDTYQVTELLRSGGSGDVFIAFHARIPGRFAVKALHHDRAFDDESRARFRSEAEITASLKHPNIVQVMDFDVTPAGVPYLVMEFVEGTHLRALIDEGPVPLERVARIVRQTANALQAAHDLGVVHRDLKPENVMLVAVQGESDFVKVVDFGLSKLLHGVRPPVTRPDQILGTPGYMAPEQILGRAADARADQFALASLTYELLTGAPPFPHGDLAALFHAVMNDPAPELSSRVSWPSAALSLVLSRALSKTPDDRYPTIAEFDRALHAAVARDAVPDEIVDVGGSHKW